MKIYPEAFEILKDLSQKLQSKEFEGRLADSGINIVMLASMVANAGNGDHVEIGTLFGASAIAAALIKQKFEFDGNVYCIDPYDDEERSNDIRMIRDEESALLNGSPEALKKNADLFGVELNLIQAKSDPWPEELADHTFASAYVDGDHLHDMPYKDFVNLSERVSGYIGFDNYEEGYPDVLGGINKALAENENWVLFYKNASFLAMRRRLPPRGAESGFPMTAI